VSRRRRDTQARRGEHKKAASPETQRWERERRPPAQPGWMSLETYAALVRLRHRLELDG
jgi:hypothetical protein